ncbi:hypothetical protein APUTEX25_001554 [Auxenochlorella protothecoides]|uniref:Uncharacterized protein n=1 Tax=Auxenochlorella protothecoides TaxID=3075 RepID=A0A3M7KQP6_AUXPR|nr:hypothetical protein APUTEX25_001554 [Auxenochlorella protothecoides]|eukprot:RMZ52164.1 hypothetical protein APUTEX25_001554 [Auxenochlorella protothecoides]
MGALHLVRSHIEPGVLGAAASVSVKLIMICSVVAWLLRTERIPADTATTLSKLAYHLLIPCLMFVRVSGTLSTIESPMLLVSIAGVATLQAALGAACGLLLGPLVDGAYPRAWAVGGWHPLRPSRPALEIAASLADAAGLDRARADALAAQPAPAPQGSRQLLVLACAFGNSFTLPAILLSTLFSGARADACVGYAALCLLVLDGLDPPPDDARIDKYVGIDPGRTKMFTAVDEHANVTSCSSKEFHAMSGSKRREKTIAKWHAKDPDYVKELHKCPTHKTASTEVLLLRVAWIIPYQRRGLAWRIYKKPFRKQRHHAYVGRERAIPRQAEQFHAPPGMTTIVGVGNWSAQDGGGIMRGTPPRPWIRSLGRLRRVCRSTMPPAQNLVILLQLSRGTRQDAPRFARTLLKLYALGTLPVTLWVTTFVAQAGLALG